MNGTREYVCPECGYDGFTMSNVRSTFADMSFQPGCPRCETVEGKTAWLVETTDPRGDELAGEEDT